jgi:nucleoid-associated protein YgaU
MVATPVKVLLFLAGGTGAAAGAAYVAGAFDWLTGAPQAVVGAAEPSAPKDEAAPKEDRLPVDPAAPPAADAAQPPVDPAKPADVAAVMPPADSAPPAAGESTPPAADAAENSPAAEPAKPEDKPAEVAALTPPADATPPAAGEPAPAPGVENPPVAEPAKPAQENPAAVNDSIVPSFDIVRVEGDGSIVIAGRASPGAYVEVLTGAIAIAGAAATPEGDFAAVPNDPLKPGDYEVKLRSTAPGNVVTLSDETALISIPEKPDGQVLAMVEKPGEASQIITKPLPVEQPAKPAKPEEVAAAEPAKPAEAVTPPAESEKPAEVAAADTAATPEPKPADAATPADEPKPAEAATPPAEPDKPAEVAAADPAQPAETEKPAEATPAEPKAEDAAAAAPEQPAAPARVAVEAVEIDGRKIFVAGAAEPNRPVRVYANEILLGDTRASPEGRFLVEAVRDLPVGNYTIRADLLSDDGQVVARAAVPFEREPGEVIAAIAPPAAAPTPEPKDEAAVPTPEPKPADVAAVPIPEDKPEISAPTPEPRPEGEAATPEPKPADVAAVPTPEPAAEPKPAEAAVPTPEPKPEEPAEVAAAPAEAGNAAAPTPEPKPDTVPAEPKPAEATPTPQPKPEQTKPAEVAVAPAEAGNTATPPAATEPATPPAADVAAAEPPAAGEVELPKLETEIAATPPEMVSPKLQASASGVIIRRGDTLWRISKRVYGRGMRYSTIYLANQDQIEDPDRIWPGQVFKVPDKTDTGEAADMTAVGEQATSVE